MSAVSLDLTRLHEAYAAGLSVEALIRDVYARIAAADDPGIFISLAPEAEALKAAAELGDFDPVAKPLWGVPFAVKDNIDVAGLETTAACPDYAYVAKADATVVARLKAAGAIVIGKTNLDQFATGLVGVRSPYPIPKNACDPSLVPGGSSSGSAVSVARGLVSFSLGTDTAGSGRVPASLNNLVGLKPSVGLVSTTGVVPACRTLDCVSIFAGTVEDAHAVLSVMAGFDATDGYSKKIPVGPMLVPPALKIGIPTPESLQFFGDDLSIKNFAASLADIAGMGHSLVPVDLTPFYKVAALLYEGAWVAERYAAIEDFIKAKSDSLHPVTRKIIGGAVNLSAADAFNGFYKLADARRALEGVIAGFDILVVPTIPYPVTLEEIAAEPVAANSRLGTYTNFVNLLDLAALAVPGRWREDGRPAGVTLIGKSGSDGLLAGFGSRLHRMVEPTIGATGVAVPAAADVKATVPAGYLPVAVVGAHLSGMALNGELTTKGAIFIEATETAPDYKLYALPGGPPFRPGVVRVPAGTGTALKIEIWALPPEGYGRFVAGIPSPLGIGTLKIAGGRTVQGFVCEAIAADGATDISSFGGWRAYMASKQA